MQIPRVYSCMMRTCVMFALIIRKILLSWMPVKCVHFLRTFVSNPEKKRISIERDHCRLTVLFAMPTAVALKCTGVLGCICPMSLRMLQKNMPIWQLWNNAPNSASAAEATMKRITFVLT